MNEHGRARTSLVQEGAAVQLTWRVRLARWVLGAASRLAWWLGGRPAFGRWLLQAAVAHEAAELAERAGVKCETANGKRQTSNIRWQEAVLGEVPELGVWDGTCAGTWLTTAELNVRETPTDTGLALGTWRAGEALFVWCRQDVWFLVLAVDFREQWVGWSHSAFLAPAQMRGVSAQGVTAEMREAARRRVDGMDGDAPK